MTGEAYLKERLTRALREKGFVSAGEINVALERPKSAEHGDLATNVAMLLAARLSRNPREIANELVEALELDSNLVSAVEVAGAGFINFRFGAGYYHPALADILRLKEKYGRTSWGDGEAVQIEFVSANPTGPLNVVSARAAAVGDVLANLFDAVGYRVEREYYVNDAGRQVRLLGQSVSARYMHLLGQQEPFPEDGYHGEYIRELAQQFLDEHGERFATLDKAARSKAFSEMALETILAGQKAVLDHYGLDYDTWFRESKLRADNAHLQVLEKLTAKGHVYEENGAKWFMSSQFGDEKDRVLVTQDGEPTYFLVDIAYHVNKYERGFAKLVDLWGPDHHGYIARVKAALVALGYPKGSFEVNIIQQVNLLRKGEIVKMSKRAGKIIEMKELLQEVGVDVARFFFLARRNQSPLDFDLDLAKNTSEENPVYYVQYAHARICNILKHAQARGVTLPDEARLDLLDQAEEMALIKKLLEFPDLISKAARYLEPHRVPTYLQELAAVFHRFYHHHRVVTEDAELTRARLLLVQGTRIVLANALRVLGVSAPEQM
ncbi:MAG: arginine--tRNA ligase [bacterium]